MKTFKKLIVVAMSIAMVAVSPLSALAAEAGHVHNWRISDAEVPSCTEDGWMLYKCDCGEEKTEVLPARHEFGSRYAVDGQVRDCGHDGVYKETCEVCGYEKITREPATGNHYWDLPKKIKNATPTTGAIFREKCVTCGYFQDVDYGNSLSQLGITDKYGNWLVVGKEGNWFVEHNLPVPGGNQNIKPNPNNKPGSGNKPSSNNTKPSAKKTFNIKVKGKNFTYTGKSIKPKLTVKANGKTVSSSAYTVKYKDNKKAGIATVTLTGRGQYKGYSGKAQFKIAPKKTTLTSVKSIKKKQAVVKWKKDSQASRYELQVSTNKKFKKASTIKISKKKTSYTAKGLKSKKNVYVRIRSVKTTSKGNVYGSWSTVKRVKVK